jgi:DNA adenine methylase
LASRSISNNCDFKRFLNSISFDDRKTPTETNESFIYCDSPYLDTNDNYSNSFNKEQSETLFNTLEAKGCKFAMSEFDHPFILEQAKQRNLNVIIIGERQNLKNRRTEILVTNYENNQKSLFE